VALADLTVGSAQNATGNLTVDGASFGVDFMTVGQDGTGTATFGSGSTGTFAAVTVGESQDAIANLTLDGATWNSGNLTIGLIGTGHATAAAGEVITVNNAVLGSGDSASGDLSVDDASLNGGTLTIGLLGAGDVTIGSGSTGSMAAVVLGEDQDASGTLTIDGAAWNVGSLAVGVAGTGQATVEAGATATIGTIVVGPDGNLAVTEAAGAAGSVIATQATIDFGVLDVSGGGQVVIGATDGDNGAVAIGANASLTGLGTLKGDVVLSNGGLVQATAPVPGALKIDGNISGAGAIQPLMTLEANGVIDSGVTIAFSPSIAAQVGDLVLDVPGGESGTITGFSTGNTIDIIGTVFTEAVFTQGTSGSPGTLTLSGGSSTPLSLLFAGDYAADAFTATPVTLSGGSALVASPGSEAFTVNSAAGASETDTVVTVISCFAAGTRIATEHGEVAVEELRIGDRMRCLFGGLAPIVWIGHRSVDCRRHPDPERVWPVRVRASTIAEGIPSRDLYLSPDHALFLDGVLIPVRRLIDRHGIEQVRLDRITYYHIELPRHDVLLAEGQPAESYLDTGDRRNFANGGGAVALHPDFASYAREADSCAPLVVTGRRLEHVRARLRARALPLPYPLPRRSHPR
jgi:collagen type I alpha